MYYVAARRFKRDGGSRFRILLDSGEDGRHHILEVRKDMRVWQMLVRRDKIVVHVDVEHAVFGGNQFEFGDVFSCSVQRLARHPGGAQGMPSMLTILQADPESVICHVPPPRQDSIILRSAMEAGQWQALAFSRRAIIRLDPLWGMPWTMILLRRCRARIDRFGALKYNRFCWIGAHAEALYDKRSFVFFNRGCS